MNCPNAPAISRSLRLARFSAFAGACTTSRRRTSNKCRPTLSAAAFNAALWPVSRPSHCLRSRAGRMSQARGGLAPQAIPQQQRPCTHAYRDRSVHCCRGIELREKPVSRKERPRQPIDNPSRSPMTPAARRPDMQLDPAMQRVLFRGSDRSQQTGQRIGTAPINHVLKL